MILINVTIQCNELECEEKFQALAHLEISNEEHSFTPGLYPEYHVYDLPYDWGTYRKSSGRTEHFCPKHK